MDIPKQYSPKEIEEKWLSFWNEHRFFHAGFDKGGESYSIVIPPPNVTAALHMGHALNNTVQDILIRWRRMQGYNTLWMPGTDHAGIATQNVVEKQLAKENISRDHLGREKFVERVWQWRDEYGGKIINQLKKLGCSCDWDRERFTMDSGLSNAVKEVFVRLYKKGLVYQGDYIINWCPRCHTALSDEEAEHRDIEGALYYITYAVKGTDEKITVATTRPETMLGDTAVALNPKDKRYNGLKGAKIILPILNREIDVIADEFVDTSFGTGIVKVTPAHDPNDFEMGLRHNLPSINVMHHDATMNEQAGPYNGMDRFACRKQLIEDLKKTGDLIKIEKHQHAVGHCYRCHTIVEPRLSRQWFVKMKPLAESAIRVVNENKIRFIPSRWEKVYLEWMTNIRDWCISRQIWWGHRIPVWTCQDCGKLTVSVDDPTRCESCKSEKLVQDNDVLDTWFSSWLWPFSTFGWPEKTKDLDFYYPTNTLATAPEILFFWVARMIMAGLEFMGDIPFSDVYLHGTVRDDSGTKMSKSLGNTIDPLDVIEEFGADALRFSIILITAQGQDVYLSPAKFEIGRNFANKLWNASRFLLMNFGEQTESFTPYKKEQLSSDDRYIIGLLHLTIKGVTEALEQFRFNEAAQIVYDFFWHSYCDKYIETAKPILYGEDETAKHTTRMVLFDVLNQTLKMLHPFMPFISEELWQRLHSIFPDDTELAAHTSVTVAPWPKVDSSLIDQAVIDLIDRKFELISAGRNLRSEYDIPPGSEIKFFIKPETEELKSYFESENIMLKKFLRASSLTIDTEFEPQSGFPSAVIKAGAIFMSLEGALDAEKESARLEGKLDKLTKALMAIRKKLSNQSFVNNAPEQVVEKEREKEYELSEQCDKIEKNLAFIRSLIKR
ncbi:MAG: valine--tRNA ligase [Candidatus Auribacterota bacterium]|jgi:valyl-tRNA synthetase|nr:valine--tRNA ligase [Candidatus Auribacterota bacterium]